jgi:hypothetical protein
MTKIQNKKRYGKLRPRHGFPLKFEPLENWNFGIVSDFVLRAWDFPEINP